MKQTKHTPHIKDGRIHHDGQTWSITQLLVNGGRIYAVTENINKIAGPVFSRPIYHNGELGYKTDRWEVI